MPVEDVNLMIVGVLSSYYEHAQRTILYRDNITPAEIGTIVRQGYALMSRNGTKNRDVGQALVTSELTRRNLNQDGTEGGRSVPSGTIADKKDQNSGTTNVDKKHDDKRNKYCRR